MNIREGGRPLHLLTNLRSKLAVGQRVRQGGQSVTSYSLFSVVELEVVVVVVVVPSPLLSLIIVRVVVFTTIELVFTCEFYEVRNLCSLYIDIFEDLSFADFFYTYN